MLWKIAFKVINSSMIILPSSDSWQRLLEELKVKDRIIPCDVTTCWNLTYDMLEFTLKYHKTIDILKVSDVCQWSMDCWVISHAQVLKDATLFFLCSTPNLAMVISAMDFINKFTAHAHNQTLSPAIKASLDLWKKTLNYYYLLTDSSEVYHIAMGTWLMFLFAGPIFRPFPCSVN